MDVTRAADIVCSFQVNGSPEPWILPASMRDEWVRLFPELDIDLELRDAYAWILGSPTRRKTARGMPRFLLAWFTRSARAELMAARARRRAAVAPTKGRWQEACEQQHRPACRNWSDHELRLEIAKSCPHPGVCRTFAECRQKPV